MQAVQSQHIADMSLLGLCVLSWRSNAQAPLLISVCAEVTDVL